jgi:hypothetical protein
MERDCNGCPLQIICAEKIDDINEIGSDLQQSIERGKLIGKRVASIREEALSAIVVQRAVLKQTQGIQEEFGGLAEYQESLEVLVDDNLEAAHELIDRFLDIVIETDETLSQDAHATAKQPNVAEIVGYYENLARSFEQRCKGRHIRKRYLLFGQKIVRCTHPRWKKFVEILDDDATSEDPVAGVKNS